MEARENKRYRPGNLTERMDTGSSSRNQMPPTVPEHIRASLPAPLLHQTKNSILAEPEQIKHDVLKIQESRSQLDDIRAKMEVLKAKRAARLHAHSSTTDNSENAINRSCPIEPPPPISFASSKPTKKFRSSQPKAL